MKEQMQNRYERVSRQVNRLRRLYSQIGEPLPVDVMIDLHRHLGNALEMGAEKKCGMRRKADRRIDA